MPNQLDRSGRNASAAVLVVVREIIGDDSIGLADDFYGVGGHSLLILRVVQRLDTQFGLTLSVRQFSVNSQIAALVDACRHRGDDAIPAEDAR